mmetsp:Transcript_39744/g.72207  ORF Transcript_39744/g.72207 Transcript_39744/m.72207 type:complete len:111 (-) Transcript_39744:83-415(-)
MPFRVMLMMLIALWCQQGAAVRPEAQESSDDESAMNASTGASASLRLDADEMALVAAGVKSIVTKTEWGQCEEVCGHSKCKGRTCYCNCPGDKSDGAHKCPHRCGSWWGR